MRGMIVAAGFTASLALAACSQQTSQAQATPEPPKSLSHPAQMYQGQEDVQSVQSASVALGKDGGVVLKAEATVPGAGYKNPGFLPQIYAASPPDGIYAVDVVADRPAAAGASTPTAIKADGEWDQFKDGRVKGIKFVSKTNSVVAMLPAKG